ncbi:MAG TPA: type II toxin-antitoxin system VapC family toxin [Candidatus Macondimonas sp.]|nr:type II toxin-antitoxin system VapC family toxin [Candidatus Macondimonas sp.]
MLYVDTSVLVAALTREPRTPEIQDWLAAQPAGQLAVSDWVVTEFSAALSVKLRLGHLTPLDRAEVLAVFAELVEGSFAVLAVSRLDFRTAARFADQHATGLRAGDALHLAVARNHGARIRALDRRLVTAAEALGVSAVLL